MGCFCRNMVPQLAAAFLAGSTVGASAQLGLSASAQADAALMEAVSAWLAARWLPAPPWQPQLEWLQLPPLAVPPISASAMATLSALVSARASCQAVLGIDLMAPSGVLQFQRVVATLNARLSAMASLSVTATASAQWEAVAALNEQVSLVAKAAAAGLFAAGAAAGPPIGPWRPLVVSVKALAPLLAICATLKLDPGDPALVATLSATVRAMAQLSLPALSYATLMLQLVARLNAMARLSASLGIDVRAAGLATVQAMVAARAASVSAQFAAGVRLQAGVLVGMPALSPNPAALLNAATIQAAAQVTPALLAGLNWQVRASAELSLLAVGAPVIALAQAMASLGLGAVRAAPCDAACDAAASLRVA